MFSIVSETPADGPAIEALLDRTFGTTRSLKVSYRFRVGVEPRRDLSRVAKCGGRLVGTIRYWPIAVDARPALLLGPLGVDPGLRGLGIGRALVRTTTALVEAGPELLPVLLVGDPPYYVQLGFAPVGPHIVMPGEDPSRLLGCRRAVLAPPGVVHSLA